MSIEQSPDQKQESPPESPPCEVCGGTKVVRHRNRDDLYDWPCWLCTNKRKPLP